MTTKHKLAPAKDVARTGSLMASMGALALASAASGAITTFGSDNDGYGGFTADFTVTTPATVPGWTALADAVQFGNDGTSNTGFVNSSLLKEYTLTRTSGTSYTIAGVIDILSTYAADNNRFGISLFAGTVNVAGIDSGLSLQHNLASGTFRILSPGVNGGTILDSATYGGLNGASAIGTTFTYRADIAFVGADIDIDFTLIDQNSHSQTVSTTVLAADYTGNHFGFGTRGRVRGTDTRIAPFIYEAKSFEVSLIPEPSAMLLLSGGIFGWTMLRRRPGSNDVSR
jgi:hypothetical protein